ncbi:uncharacterized protein MYCFIDRAFT_82536 [Pseudocercospora fijiensis CIRAD86]|uniref:Uncharacterized protein n=1 Tax=Pseudocercospora fijiensis (strain CIRAD86) TaxID=383855 RepID=M3AMC2_PSEFD|nr:uncharacterized protein MYCFIDRAFT_82536 [Pseudocercospora fijiensis CIRAD86]EME85726.1 hypothetical protein MYCFIDRAFT_82536 [Pseudocercospora fijiensis CIRAD86]
MDLSYEYLEYSYETRQHMLGCGITTSDSDQAENNSPESAVRPQDDLEGLLILDSAMPTPVSNEDNSANPETEESFNHLFDEGENSSLFGEGDAKDDSSLFGEGDAGDQSSLFGVGDASNDSNLLVEGDAGEEIGASSQDKSEEPVRHDAARPSPAPIESDSDDQDVWAQMDELLKIDGDDTEASSPNKPEDVILHDSAMPSPDQLEIDSREDDCDSMFEESSEDISTRPPVLPTVGDNRPTALALSSRQPPSPEQSLAPSRRPLALPPQRPQPAVELRNTEDPAHRFPHLSLPRQKPVVPAVASSTTTPSAQADPHPVASVDVQSRKRRRDDDPIEIEDSSPVPVAKKSRNKKTVSSKDGKAGKKSTRTGSKRWTNGEIDSTNETLRIMGATRTKEWMQGKSTDSRYAKRPPIETKRAKERREAAEQSAAPPATAETELPELNMALLAHNLDNDDLWAPDGTLLSLPTDVADTAISVSSNGTTGGPRGEPPMSASQASPPASLFTGRSNSGASSDFSSTIIDLTDDSSSACGISSSTSLSTGRSDSGISMASSHTTIDLTGESGPACGATSSASLASGMSNSGTSTTSSRITIDLTAQPETASAMQRSRGAESAQTAEAPSSPGPNLPAPTYGKSSYQTSFLRDQEEALNGHKAELEARLRVYRAQGHMTEIEVDMSGPGGIWKARTQLKNNMTMAEWRSRQKQ